MSVSARNQLARHHLLLQRAAQHRASPTPAERLLWSLLRAKECGAWLGCPHSPVLSAPHFRPVGLPQIRARLRLRASGGDFQARHR